jgi:hypothetical protein
LFQFRIGHGQCIAICSILVEMCGISRGFENSSNPAFSMSKWSGVAFVR